jgi:taurine dioxygenase
MYVANKKFDGMESVLPEGEMQYHTDQCYYETPSRATILFAIEIPAEGGNTKFANAYRAYESLDDAMKTRLQGLKALNVYDYDANSTIKRYESSPDAPRYAHPVVIRHPETGREVLYINRLMSDHIVGMDRAESDALLEELFQVLEDPAHCYEHVWTPGDLVMWDNLCTLHARTWFDPSQSRVLRRTTVAGKAPDAAIASAA